MKKNTVYMAIEVLFFALLVFGCDRALRGREVEVIPGMTWEYCSLRHSRVVWDKYGVIAEGDVFISFYDYGFSFCSNGKCRYVDAVRNVLVPSDLGLGNGKRYGAMDASSAVGAFSREPHLEFLREVSALRERVKRRLASESGNEDSTR